MDSGYEFTFSNIIFLHLCLQQMNLVPQADHILLRFLCPSNSTNRNILFLFH
ncbi:uncharacterized protein DS421_1g21930 [Arachis hypogaea]|nr:uncharacterized protein DS421_1g21930 [Arachis hypogaea]